MDETSVNTANASKQGLHASVPQCDFRTDEAPTKKQKTMPCTLLGTICDIDALQKILPQVLLPKYVKNESPPDKIKTAFAETGAPLEAWHKTGGWNNCSTMISWLRQLHRHVNNFDKDLNIILVLDCATAHLNDKLLKVARMLKVNILMVPSKCTWFIQPLDVYSFAFLKRSLRRKLSQAEILSPTGNVTNINKIRVIGEAVQEELVEHSWSQRMAKVGLSVDLNSLRVPLQRITDGMDLTARQPTQEELLCVLSKECKFNRIAWHSLLMSDFAESTSETAVATDFKKNADVYVGDMNQQSAEQVVTSSSSSAHRDTTASGSGAQLVRSAIAGVPIRATRLPSAVNFDFTPEMMPRVGPSAGTRSCTKKKGMATCLYRKPNSKL